MEIQVRMTSRLTGRVLDRHFSARALANTDGIEGLMEEMLTECTCGRAAESNIVECDCVEEWEDAILQIGDEIPEEQRTPRSGKVYIVENNGYVDGWYLDRPSAERVLEQNRFLSQKFKERPNIDLRPYFISEVHVGGFDSVQSDIWFHIEHLERIPNEWNESSVHYSKFLRLMLVVRDLFTKLAAKDFRPFSEYERERLDMMRENPPTTLEAGIIDLERLRVMLSELPASRNLKEK